MSNEKALNFAKIGSWSRQPNIIKMLMMIARARKPRQFCDSFNKFSKVYWVTHLRMKTRIQVNTLSKKTIGFSNNQFFINFFFRNLLIYCCSC